MVKVPMFNSLDEEIAYYEKRNGKRSHTKQYAKRTVSYVGPGHTRVTYAHRVLDIKFKQSPEEYQTLKKRRSKTYKETKYRNMKERVTTAERHKDLAKGHYTIEDMRARLRDDHWEEVCHHKRWNYDSNSTVKEFKKYLASHRKH